MEGLYLVVCIIGVCVQIYSLLKLKGNKESKYWNLFVGISVADIVAVFIAYGVFSSSAMGLNDAATCLLICGFSFFINIVVLIIGLVIKKSIKDETIKLNKLFFIINVLVILINVIFIWFIPLMAHKIHIMSGEKRIVNYLEDKYGEGNYKIINTYSEYTNDGMWDKHVSGYYYEIKSNHMDATFFVTVDDNLKYIYEDYFLPVYFSKENDLSYELRYDESRKELVYDFSDFNNYVIKNEKVQATSKPIDPKDIYLNHIEAWSSSLGVEYSSNYYIVPSDNGRIPTIEEVIDGLLRDM